MREVVPIAAAALTVAMLSLLAAMPIVAGWRMPVEQASAPPPINPFKLMGQAQHLRVQQIEDFSMIY